MVLLESESHSCVWTTNQTVFFRPRKSIVALLENSKTKRLILYEIVNR